MTDLNSQIADSEEVMISRRRRERVIARGRVQAWIHTPESGTKQFTMEILEISPAGLKLRTPKTIDTCKMVLIATIDGFPEDIELSTYVRWQEEDDQGYTLFGVEIDDTEASDLDTWCEFQREEWFKTSTPVN